METSNTTVMVMQLMNNETLITYASVDETTGFILCRIPALLIHERLQSGVVGFVLKPWVPFELLAAPAIKVAPERITGYMMATTELATFYGVWAKIEEEHLKEYEDAYKGQIKKLTKSYAEAYAVSAAERNANKSPEDIPSDVLIRLFEENVDWGDSTKIH